MTSATVENLRKNLPEQPLRRIAIFTTVGLAANPTEIIAYDGSAYLTIPCLDGYRHRRTGDKIVAAQLAGNDWVVLGKISADDSPIVAVAQGTGPPPDGFWRHAANVWVADHMDGRQSLYLDMTGAAPAPVIVFATDAATWIGSSSTRSSFYMDQVSIPTWYYSGGIAAACSGKTVTAMFLRVTRTDDGADNGIPFQVGMHNQTDAGQPTTVNSWNPALIIAPGQTVLVPVPSGFVGALATGSVVKGFFLFPNTDTPLPAMQLDTAADLQIHFG
jgi:hypothetical protein